MADTVQIYLFGDNTYETNAKLCALLPATDDPILVAFFDQAFDVIRSEVGRLPLQELLNLPSFASLADILARHREGRLSPAFQISLATIYHLGSFIRYVQRF